MEWGFDRRFAVAGLAVGTFFGIAGAGVTILWPEAKVGWSLLAVAAVILYAWIVFEIVQWVGRPGNLRLCP